MGLVCIVVGVLVLLAYSGLVPHRVTKWWPILIVAAGLLLLISHYWRAYRERTILPPVIDGSSGAMLSNPRTGRIAPPAFPVIVIAVGVYLLLRNLVGMSTYEILAIVLIALGCLFLLGNLRASATRT